MLKIKNRRKMHFQTVLTHLVPQEGTAWWVEEEEGASSHEMVEVEEAPSSIRVCSSWLRWVSGMAYCHEMLLGIWTCPR